jgi:hypothetical protein
MGIDITLNMISGSDITDPVYIQLYFTLNISPAFYIKAGIIALSRVPKRHRSQNSLRKERKICLIEGDI